MFAPAYATVTLTQLNGGVTTLKGGYADNVSNQAVSSATRSYLYNRSQAGFVAREADPEFIRVLQLLRDV